MLGFVPQEMPDICDIYFFKEDRSVVEKYSAPGVGTAAWPPPWEPAPLRSWHVPCFPGWESDGFVSLCRGDAGWMLVYQPCLPAQSWRALERARVGVPWMISYFKTRGAGGKDSESQKV